MKKSEVRSMIVEEIKRIKEALSAIDAPEMAKVAKKHGFKIKLDSKRKVGSAYVWDFDVLNNKINRIKISNAGGKADTANVYSGESTKNGVVFKNYEDLFSQIKKLKENKMLKSEVRDMIIEELEALKEGAWKNPKGVDIVADTLEKYSPKDGKIIGAHHWTKLSTSIEAAKDLISSKADKVKFEKEVKKALQQKNIKVVNEEMQALREANFKELAKMALDLEKKLKQYKITDKKKAKEAEDALAHLNAVLDSI